MTASSRMDMPTGWPRLLVVPPALLAVALLTAAGSSGGARLGSAPLLAVIFGLALVVQWLAFVPAYIGRTERYFDLIGSLTYLSLVGVALALGPEQDARSVVLAVLVAVWAARLGTYLFRRIRAEGSDGRFDAIRGSFPNFFVAWTLQGVWICFTAGAALTIITSPTSVPLGPVGYAGLGLWIVGFGIEAIADRQKSAFREDPANAGAFITEGLWGLSRHPNYFGEIVLWFGIAVIAAPALQGWQLLTLVSPLFVTVLLTRVSGINLLEERADARWGGDPTYEAYKKATPRLVPRLWELPGAVRTALLLGALMAAPSALAAQIGPFTLEIEGGSVWQSSNDVEIPNDGTATRFDLAGLAGRGPFNAGRIYLDWRLADNHALRLLAAPLSVTEVGTPTGSIDFEGASFAGSSPVLATYRFNSYRLSYRWRFHGGTRANAWLGFTAKVRDASIGLVQGAISSRKDDLGFVPLLHLAGDVKLADGWRLALDTDALAGGPGRAVDASVKASWDLDDRWSLSAGYRTVEGGADVASVYNFAWLHYAVASVSLRW